MTVACAPMSAAVSARAVTISSREMAKQSVQLVVNVPENRAPSDLVTAAAASGVSVGTLSAIVMLAGVSVIAVGVRDASVAIVHKVCVADIACALETTEKELLVRLSQMV